MNERDYKLLEFITLFYGISISIIMIVLAFLFFEIRVFTIIFSLLPFLFGLFLSVLLFLKHKKYVNEMYNYVKVKIKHVKK